MTSPHSAAPQALGYAYQIEIALYLLLRESGGEALSLEHIDDVAFHDEKEEPKDRLQIKHHKRRGSLSDTSPDLWKTIKVWCDEIDFSTFSERPSTLTILTTAIASEGSIASLLRPENRGTPTEIVGLLDNIAESSKNTQLADSFSSYLSMTENNKISLVKAIVILDNSPLIREVGERIKNLLITIRPIYRDAALERIRGWWYGKAYQHLIDPDNHRLIIKGEVNQHLAYIAEQFGPNVLPMDFRRKSPEIPEDAESRIFVKQLEMIDMSKKIIEQAILDYYRAFWQRSFWIRDSLLDSADELSDYENRLIEEWRIFSEEYKMKLGTSPTDDDLRECGRNLYFSVIRNHIPIRTEVREYYFMRGNYHILADCVGEKQPSIGWHPEFVQRLAQIFSGVS